MQNRLRVVKVIVIASIVSGSYAALNAPAQQRAAAPAGQAQYRAPRTPDGKPNMPPPKRMRLWSSREPSPSREDFSC